jgi:membrane associated rhomboid family serine protease
VATYLLCGTLASFASLLFAPAAAGASLGASGAVFGLFVVGVLTKVRPSPRRLLEALVLGTFVTRQLGAEVGAAAAGGRVAAGGAVVGHAAHLAGAAAGGLLVLLLSRLPRSSGR